MRSTAGLGSISHLGSARPLRYLDQLSRPASGRGSGLPDRQTLKKPFVIRFLKREYLTRPGVLDAPMTAMDLGLKSVWSCLASMINQSS